MIGVNRKLEMQKRKGNQYLICDCPFSMAKGRMVVIHIANVETSANSYLCYFTDDRIQSNKRVIITFHDTLSSYGTNLNNQVQ